MTNQDAIKIIKTAIAEVEWEYPMEYAAAFDKAIEALEQEPVLDKIIADIGSALSEEVLDDNRQRISDVGIGLEIALRIIGKYKVESEGA